MSLSKPAIFKGLDVNTNILGRDPDRAVDCSNVYLNESDELRNRPFFSPYTFPANTFLGSIKGLQTSYFKDFEGGEKGKRKKYMLAFASGEDVDSTMAGDNSRGKVLRILSHTATPLVEGPSLQDLQDFVTHECQYNAPSCHFNLGPYRKGYPVKKVSYLDVDYFPGIYGLWKYDGLQANRAGLPKFVSVLAGSGSGTTYYYRTFLANFDFSAGWTFGDYDEETSTIVTLTIAYDASGGVISVQDALSTGMWDDRYIVLSGAPTVNLGTREVTIPSTDKNVIVNDVMTIYSAGSMPGISDNTIGKARVKAVTGATVVLDMDDAYVCDLSQGGGFYISDVYWAIFAGGSSTNNVISNQIMVTYVSTAPSSGYKFSKLRCFKQGLGISITTSVPSVNNAPSAYPFTLAFEDCYDEAKTKGLLPTVFDGDESTEIKGIAIYNNILLAFDDDYIYYSDVSVGSNVENFDPLDFFPVGTTEDGPISAVFANDEYIIVHREKNSYYVSGNITTGSYRVSSINSDRFGAISHGGQSSLLAQNFYVSQKGAHAISRGGNPTEMGLLVEPIFKNKLTTTFGTFPRLAEELPLVNCAEDDLKNHIYVFFEAIPASDSSRVLVYNYRVKEWYFWILPIAFQKVSTSIIGGAACREGELWLSDGVSLMIENTADTGPDASFEEGFWTSVYRHESAPSLEKRYKYLKLFSVEHDAIPSTVNIQCRYDWETSAMIDQGDLVLPNTEVTPPQGFDMRDLTDRNAYAFQFRIASDEYLKLQGYELDVELVQEEMTR